MSGRGAARRVVDLSHDIVSGRPGYPGLPVPRVEPWKSHAASRADYGGQAEFEITRLFLVGSTGTYLDSPYHRFASASDIAGLSVERLVGLPGRVVDVTRPRIARSGQAGSRRTGTSPGTRSCSARAGMPAGAPTRTGPGRRS